MRVRSVYRKLVFAMVMLGICAFAIAERNPGMLLIIATIGGLSWWVTQGPHGKPLPRPVIIVAAVAVMTWLLLDLFVFRTHTLLAMGHFTIWLQLLLLYSHKTNREYAQLMLLSILQMIGASTISISMLYGFMLAIYCVLTLFTILVFHMKLTSDRIYKSRQNATDDQTKALRPVGIANAGLGKNLTYYTFFFGIICILIASGIFTTVPRSPEKSPLSRLASFSSNTQTGFSDTVDLNFQAPQSNNDSPILSFTIQQNGKNIGSKDRFFLLRGAVLDRYNPDSNRWFRGNYVRNYDHPIILQSNTAVIADIEPPDTQYSATFTYRDDSQSTLFSFSNVYLVDSETIKSVSFNTIDQQMRILRDNNKTTEYTIHWTASENRRISRAHKNTTRQITGILGWNYSPANPRNRNMTQWYARGWYTNFNQINAFANQIIKPHNLSRNLTTKFATDDLEIANTIVQYLQTNYQYSLRGPAGNDPTTNADPISRFLFNEKQGHCELFASATAALLRSLGIQARVITGFRASEYNDIGSYYLVRASDAHAWTEVNIGGQWVTLDATPPAQVADLHAPSTGLLASIKNLYEYLDYVWLSSVVTFDDKSQRSMLATVQSLFNNGDDGSTPGILYRAWHMLLSLLTFFRWKYIVIALILVVIAAVLIGFYFLHAFRTSRKATRLHLSSLPRHKQRALAQQLGFFLTLQKLLAKHGHTRKAWQSPMQFANQLIASDPQRFAPVQRLTHIFYDIRYGNRQLDQQRKSQVEQELANLQSTLNA